MPRTTQEVDLKETLESKRTERKQLVSEAAQLADANPAFETKMREAQQLDTHIKGINEVADEWNSITLIGMTGGECARMENALAEEGSGMGDARIETIYYGSEDAPYIVTDESDDVDEPKTYYEIGQLPVSTQKWIEDEVNELTDPSGNLQQTSADLLREMRHEADGTEDSSSSGT